MAAEDAGTVTYVGKCSVPSTRQTEAGKFCQLSVLDRLMEQNRVQIVYYYPSRGDNDVVVEPGHWLKKLRETLSIAITNFTIIHGRLMKNQQGHWTIKCNDAGVRMMEAKVNGTVEDWLKSVDCEKERQLVYWEDMYHKPYYWPTFYFQVTEFEKGGLAISLSCTHLIADPISATMFIKAWADTTLSGIMLNPPFFHSLPRPKQINPNQQIPFTNDLIHYYKSCIESGPTQYPLMVTNQNYATITLAFTDPMVRACIAMANDEANHHTKSCSSPAFEALAALFWVCISKAKGRVLNMSVCLDTRRVIGLDQGFFGNCMVYNKVGLECVGEDMLLAEARKAVREAVEKVDDGEGIKGLIQWLHCNDGDHQTSSIPLMNDDDVLVCANLEGVNPYLATFQDRVEPLRVSYYVEPVVGAGQVVIFRSPPRPGEGPLSRVVMATLPAEEAAKLCEDDLIQHFAPTVLMGTSTTYKQIS